MDFTLTPEWEDLRTQVRNFIGDEVLYLEEDRAHYDDHENIALPVLEEKRAADDLQIEPRSHSARQHSALGNESEAGT